MSDHDDDIQRRGEDAADYLWDRSGPPDPEVARLEKLLGPLAHDAPLAAPATKPRRSRAPFVGAAIGALALAAVLWLVVRRPPAPRPNLPVASLCGAPTEGSYAFRVEGRSGVLCGDEERRGGWVPQGGVLETRLDSRATLEIAKLGTVAVAPGTKLRLVPGKGDEHKLDLVRGSLHARIDAPPRIFVVKTPLTDAVDLGCEYELTVDETGAGVLSVSYGSVSLERDSRAPTLVTQGASCRITARGPGTPLSNGASDVLKSAASELDAGDATAFDRVLRAADEQDTLTLWHLMRRIDPEERGRAWDRLKTFVPPPEKASRAAVVAGERSAIAAYRDALAPRWFHSPTW